MMMVTDHESESYGSSAKLFAWKHEELFAFMAGALESH